LAVAPGRRPLASPLCCGHFGHCSVTQTPIFGCVASELMRKSWNHGGYVEPVKSLFRARPSSATSSAWAASLVAASAALP